MTNDRISSLITLTPGGQTSGYRFGRLPLPVSPPVSPPPVSPPPVSPLSSSLSGTVFRYPITNGTLDEQDYGIANIPIVLTGKTQSGVAIRRQVVTSADGSYSFGNLPARASTVIREIRPNTFLARIVSRSAAWAACPRFKASGQAGQRLRQYRRSRRTGRLELQHQQPGVSTAGSTTSPLRSQRLQALQAVLGSTPLGSIAIIPGWAAHLRSTNGLVNLPVLRRAGPLISQHIPSLIRAI